MSDPTQGSGSPRRRRVVPLVWLGSLGALLLLAAGTSSTLAGFTASINNTTNTAASGTLLMEEDQSTTTCLSSSGSVSTANSGTCGSINKYGGSTTMAPGVAVTTNITIKNIGTIPANTFTLTPGACTQAANGTMSGSATDFCSKLDVTITSGSTTIFNGTAASLAAGGAISLPAPVASGASVPFTFTTKVDASVDNSYQGLSASQPLTWSFAS